MGAQTKRAGKVGYMMDLLIAFAVGVLLGAGLICNIILVVKDEKIEIVDDDETEHKADVSK